GGVSCSHRKSRGLFAWRHCYLGSRRQRAAHWNRRRCKIGARRPPPDCSQYRPGTAARRRLVRVEDYRPLSLLRACPVISFTFSEQPLKLILKAPKQTFFRGKETTDSLRAMFWILGEVLHPGKPYAAARLFMNRFADHRQSLVRNLKHVVRRRDVVCEFGDHFLVTDAARFELTPGNEIEIGRASCRERV